MKGVRSDKELLAKWRAPISGAECHIREQPKGRSGPLNLRVTNPPKRTCRYPGPEFNIEMGV